MARIVITGASRGIGEALALAYAEPGASLVLAGRDGERLAAVADRCRAVGAVAETCRLDLRDRAGLAEALGRIDEAGPVDLLIANAGIHRPTSPEPAALAAAREEIATNLLGTLDSIEPVAVRMVARGRGRIALVSSLAAYVPMPDSPGYAASKAGLLALGLSLRERLRPAGVGVSVVCPGFVDGGMGERFRGRRPLVVPADLAARAIRRGIERGDAVVAFPWALAAATRAVGLAPEWLARMLLAGSRFRVEAPCPHDREKDMDDLDAVAARVGARLVARGETIAVSESSAGGLISSGLLAVPGASAFFMGGAVVYTAKAREVLLGITADEMRDLAIRSASEPYATLCARAVRTRFATTWGLSETGAAGPTGNRYGDAAGHACFALAGVAERATTLETGHGDRAVNMRVFAAAALALLEGELG